MDDSAPTKWMTADRWQRIKDLAAGAAARNPAERRRFVAASCGDDAEMVREVLRLLAESESTVGIATMPLAGIPQGRPHEIEGESCFSPGQLVSGRFEIIRFLNRGGMGEVYAALDLELKETVALKTIRPSFAASPGAIERFKHEVKQTRHITHPNVCRVYDLFSHEPPLGEPIWFLTMELLEGETLSKRLAAGNAMDFEQALPLVRDMVAGLGAAHEMGIVHRDFKPSNVMLVTTTSRRTRAVVTDFGLALSVSPEEGGSRETAKEGSPAYMAPEQAARGPVGVAADQFALGLVICEMLTGERPRLKGAGAGEWRARLQAWFRAQPKEHLNARARQVAARCLEFRAQDRFPDVRQIVPILDGSRRRRRLRRATAAVIATVVIAGTAIAIARQDWGDRITGAARLTPDTDLAGYPSVSRDGRWVAYMSDRAEPGNLDIWIQPLAGGPSRRLTTDPHEDTEPNISPDGKLVVFRSERNGGGVYVVSADGSGERLLAPEGRGPVFSPDGRTIVYWIGNRDDYSAPSGRLYEVSVSGGEPRRLAADFADARWPTWSSDGQLLLFEGCRTAGPLSECADWRAAHPDGTAAANLGVLALLRRERIFRQVPPSKVWQGDRMVFSGRRGSTTSLWELTVSRRQMRVTGKPRRITSGDAVEVEPFLAGDGTIVYGRGFWDRHIWRLQVLPEGVRETRVTDDPATDACPSVTRDGRTLFFTRTVRDFAQVMTRDLQSGRESIRYASNADKLWPIPDATGDRVAFESRGAAGSSIELAAPGGPARVLCTPCSNPTSWFDDRAVFYPTARGEIALVSVDTGASRVVLKPQSGSILSEADWNPTREDLLFTASRNGGPKQVFAVRFPRATAAAEGAWIPITSDAGGVDRPRWSTDGNALFYLSKRDGFSCIWGQRFDGSPIGDPFSVRHYHNQRFTPRRTMSSALGLAVAGESLYVNVGEISVTLWKGELNRPTPLSLLSRFFGNFR